MSKITRQTMLWFGSSSDSSSVGVFGSLAVGSPAYSKVIATIQSLPAWGSGWKAEVIASQRPALQDFNAVDYVFSYGLCYLHEMGIPEWDSGTVYYQNSYCQVSGVIYYSLQDNNLNQNPVSAPSYWALLSVTGAQLTSLSGIPAGAGVIPSANLPAFYTPTSYDSGWFAISTNSNYAKTHSLNTTKVMVTCIGAASSDGSGTNYVLHSYADLRPGSDWDSLSFTLTTSVITAYTSGTLPIAVIGGSPVYMGSLRIIILALP